MILARKDMTKKEFKDHLVQILNQKVANLSWNEKISLARKIIIELDVDSDYDQSNKGKAWTDDGLRLILQMQPTKENMMHLAKAFKRGYRSIEQIYRWASADKQKIEETRSNDSFILQIKKIASEVGWRI